MVLRDLFYMEKALALAHEAFEKQEVPIGALVVDPNGVILGSASNCVELSHDPLGHAEIRAIRQAAQASGNWRLTGCTLYVTLEPCALCMQAIIASRISRLVFGARSPLYGFSLDRHTIFRLYKMPITVHEGVCAEQSLQLLKKFFQQRRRIDGDHEKNNT
jgi:tRNA(adenine34) deaminase